MIKKFPHLLLVSVVIIVCLTFWNCKNKNETVNIGVSFGVGVAERWDKEMRFMEARAKELGVDIEFRLNRGSVKSQNEDCIELIDKGIDILIYTPRDASDVSQVFGYARERGVYVLTYSRVVLNSKMDLFVGYDSERIGQRMGQYFTDMIYKGDIIIFSGDIEDNNAKMLKDGAMRYLEPLRKNFNIILDSPVKGWSPELAKQMVKEAVSKNGNKIDAIFAPNDRIAGGSLEALRELGIKNHVVITGMDAELDAVRRIAAGTQDMTIYMDLRELATTAINEAVNLVKKEKVNINSEFQLPDGSTVKANLITGQVVTKENIYKLIIERGIYTNKQIYGESK